MGEIAFILGDSLLTSCVIEDMGGLGGDFCELLLLIILWLDVVEDEVEEDDEEDEGGGEFVIGTSSSLIPFSM